jgi:hypothetical protein
VILEVVTARTARARSAPVRKAMVSLEARQAPDRGYLPSTAAN